MTRPPRLRNSIPPSLSKYRAMCGGGSGTGQEFPGRGGGNSDVERHSRDGSRWRLCREGRVHMRSIESIWSSPKAVSVGGCGTQRKSVSGRKPRRSWTLDKYCRSRRRGELGPGQDPRIVLETVERVTGKEPTLQLSRNGWSDGFGLKFAGLLVSPCAGAIRRYPWFTVSNSLPI